MILFTGAHRFGELSESGLIHGILIGGAVLNAAGMIGLLRRTGWGRVLGIICCALMMLNFPIGTGIGLLGIIAMAGSPRLFGPNRLNPKDLEAEIKLRKRR